MYNKALIGLVRPVCVYEYTAVDAATAEYPEALDAWRLVGAIEVSVSSVSSMVVEARWPGGALWPVRCMQYIGPASPQGGFSKVRNDRTHR